MVLGPDLFGFFFSNMKSIGMNEQIGFAMFSDLNIN